MKIRKQLALGVSITDYWALYIPVVRCRYLQEELFYTTIAKLNRLFHFISINELSQFVLKYPQIESLRTLFLTTFPTNSKLMIKFLPITDHADTQHLINPVFGVLFLYSNDCKTMLTSRIKKNIQQSFEYVKIIFNFDCSKTSVRYIADSIFYLVACKLQIILNIIGNTLQKTNVDDQTSIDVKKCKKTLADLYLSIGLASLAIDNYVLFLNKVDITSPLYLECTMRIASAVYLHSLKLYQSVCIPSDHDNIVLPSEFDVIKKLFLHKWNISSLFHTNPVINNRSACSLFDYTTYYTFPDSFNSKIAEDSILCSADASFRRAESFFNAQSNFVDSLVRVNTMHSMSPEQPKQPENDSHSISSTDEYVTDANEKPSDENHCMQNMRTFSSKKSEDWQNKQILHINLSPNYIIEVHKRYLSKSPCIPMCCLNLIINILHEVFTISENSPYDTNVILYCLRYLNFLSMWGFNLKAIGVLDFIKQLIKLPEPLNCNRTSIESSIIYISAASAAYLLGLKYYYATYLFEACRINESLYLTYITADTFNVNILPALFSYSVRNKNAVEYLYQLLVASDAYKVKFDKLFNYIIFNKNTYSAVPHKIEDFSESLHATNTTNVSEAVSSISHLGSNLTQLAIQKCISLKHKKSVSHNNNLYMLHCLNNQYIIEKVVPTNLISDFYLQKLLITNIIKGLDCLYNVCLTINDALFTYCDQLDTELKDSLLSKIKLATASQLHTLPPLIVTRHFLSPFNSEIRTLFGLNACRLGVPTLLELCYINQFQASTYRSKAEVDCLPFSYKKYINKHISLKTPGTSTSGTPNNVFIYDPFQADSAIKDKEIEYCDVNQLSKIRILLYNPTKNDVELRQLKLLAFDGIFSFPKNVILKPGFQFEELAFIPFKLGPLYIVGITCIVYGLEVPVFLLQHSECFNDFIESSESVDRTYTSNFLKKFCLCPIYVIENSPFFQTTISPLESDVMIQNPLVHDFLSKNAETYKTPKVSRSNLILNVDLRLIQGEVNGAAVLLLEDDCDIASENFNTSNITRDAIAEAFNKKSEIKSNFIILSTKKNNQLIPLKKSFCTSLKLKHVTFTKNDVFSAQIGFKEQCQELSQYILNLCFRFEITSNGQKPSMYVFYIVRSIIKKPLSIDLEICDVVVKPATPDYIKDENSIVNFGFFSPSIQKSIRSTINYDFNEAAFWQCLNSASQLHLSIDIVNKSQKHIKCVYKQNTQVCFRESKSRWNFGVSALMENKPSCFEKFITGKLYELLECVKIYSSTESISQAFTALTHKQLRVDSLFNSFVKNQFACYIDHKANVGKVYNLTVIVFTEEVCKSLDLLLLCILPSEDQKLMQNQCIYWSPFCERTIQVEPEKPCIVNFSVVPKVSGNCTIVPAIYYKEFNVLLWPFETLKLNVWL